MLRHLLAPLAATVAWGEPWDVEPDDDITAESCGYDPIGAGQGPVD